MEHYKKSVEIDDDYVIIECACGWHSEKWPSEVEADIEFCKHKEGE